MLGGSVRIAMGKHVCCIKPDVTFCASIIKGVENRCQVKIDTVAHCDALSKYLSRINPALFIFFLTDFDNERKAIYDLIRGLEERPPVLCVLDEYNWESYVDLCCEFGMNDFIIMPLQKNELVTRIRKAIDLSHNAVLNKTKQYLKQKYGRQRIVGQDPDFLRAVKHLMMISQVDAPALIWGETGTGKELFAQAMHYLSPRASKPFVPVNCGAIPVKLFENELFGHVRGAYTDARTPQQGFIAEAEGGTLFLDEVDAIPYPAQVKLLRFLQEGEYKVLGSSTVRKSNVRIVAASNVDLTDQPDDVMFRKDLLFRLNVFSISIPPLRDRKSDIPLLADFFIKKFAGQYRILKKRMTKTAMKKLLAYHWPGNVRELENVILKSMILPRRAVIQANDIELPAEQLRFMKFKKSFRELKINVVDKFEKDFLIEVLQDCGDNVTQAAQIAGIDRRSFYRLLKKHRLR